MKVIEVLKKRLDFSHFVKRSALESDSKIFINEDTLITVEGNPIILYKKIETPPNLRAAAVTLRYAKSTRTAGIKTKSRIFGYRPRNTIRNDYCSASSLSFEQQSHQAVLSGYANHIEKIYKEYFPTVFERHSNEAKKISESWKIGQLFTSGIANKNNPLKYHFDAGNVKNVASNMVVFKNDVGGGFLSCPEYDLLFECADNTIIIFDGQNILHGVTPINRKSKAAYRHSIVYYTLLQMWQCLEIVEEIKRANRVRFKRENNRSNGVFGVMAKDKTLINRYKTEAKQRWRK
jgi:hypothetical protein